MPTLEDYQEEIYTDLLSCYRQDERDRDAKGNSTGLRLVFESQPAKKHDTDNYDSHMSAAGQSKMNNIDTSDKGECHIDLDIRAEDTVLLGTEWFTVAGAPKRRRILNYQRFYLTTTRPPKIAEGTWNG